MADEGEQVGFEDGLGGGVGAQDGADLPGVFGSTGTVEASAGLESAVGEIAVGELTEGAVIDGQVVQSLPGVVAAEAECVIDVDGCLVGLAGLE